MNEGATASYTVALATKPTADVTVSSSSDDPGAVRVSGALIFTTENWATAQPATVTGVQDADDSDETVMVTHTASGGGYDEVTSSLTVEVVDVMGGIDTGVCDRTPQVRDALVQSLSSPPRNCKNVTDAHLASIDVLDLSDQGITALKAGDFAGLTSLTTLNLDRNDLTELPAEIFSGLSSLTTLDLSFNNLTTLQRNAFSGLSNLTTLYLNNNNSFSGNRLAIQPGAFFGLSSLEILDLSDSRLAPLPVGVFTGLSNLEELDLSGNELMDLPASVFSGLSGLKKLDLSRNDLVTLPAGIFDGLALEDLDLRFNPGAPFTATLELFRADNEGLRAPGPATVAVKLVSGGRLPFPEGPSPMPVALPFDVGGIEFTAEGGTISPWTGNTSAGETEIATGVLSSNAFRVTQTGDDPVALEFYSDPTVPFFRAITWGSVQVELGRPLVLFGGAVIPLFKSASNPNLRGFFRIINHSDRAGTVLIYAIDDSGERFGPVSLSLNAKETVHFNSTDLEQGNASKGLPEGVGDGDGDWRLELDTDLDIEPLAYVRTADGFVTSIHDVAPEVAPRRYRVPIFNPGSNRSQVSLLRLINPGDRDAEIVVGGLDDRGEPPPEGNIRLTLATGAERTLTAQQLEQGGNDYDGRFGEGAGKWQLSVSADQPIQVMSLLLSPTGNLTNLSRGTSSEERTLPLVTPASNAVRQGFVRIINHSDRAGTVRIHAIDDSGQRFGPVSLSLEAKETAHLNSRDLEQGNAPKGLSEGVGDGDGDWRLELDTDLDIEPLAYIRTADGFVTSVHDVTAEVAPGRYRVPIFNPGSNRSQISHLRLINPADTEAEVEIIGLDDRGEPPEGRVRLTLPAGTARTISAQELESGGNGFSGRLGDGTGKWQLSVFGSRPIQIMNLLRSPTGHLANLTTSTSGFDFGPPTNNSNRPPENAVRFFFHNLTLGTPITFDVSFRFRDRDGDILRYTATSSDTNVVTASVSGNAVTITPVSVGAADVTMMAHDPYGATVTQTTEMRVGEGDGPITPPRHDCNSAWQGDPGDYAQVGVFCAAACGAINEGLEDQATEYCGILSDWAERSGTSRDDECPVCKER